MDEGLNSRQSLNAKIPVAGHIGRQELDVMDESLASRKASVREFTSQGEAARDAQVREATGGGGAEAAAAAEKKDAVVAAGKKEWSVGEFCRATFTEDGTEYEGKLTSIEVDSDGNKYGIVRYIGFENEETQWLDDLKPSQGDEARSKQIRDAKGDGAEAVEKAPEAKKAVDEAPEAGDKAAKLANADDPKVKGTKDWKVGDR